MRSIFYIFFLSTFLFAQSRFDSFYFHQLESKTDPKELYVKYCASCHHEKRVGISAPPLLPIFLKKINDKRLFDIIKNSLPQTLMPKFDFLSDDEIFAIIKYLRSPEKDISWNLEDIKNSYQIVDKKEKRLNIKNHEDITLVVERGANRVWIMENKEILDWFNFNNVHGGLKFTLDGKNFYVPTRDGWIGHYSLKEGRLKDKIRACINLRNISLSRDGKKIFATCLMPQAVVIFDSLTLKPLKKIDLDGKISALYELYSKDEAIFTFRDKSNLVKIDTNSLELKYFDLKEPIEDFFIDPFEEFIIGTTRNGKRLSVYDIDRLQKVFEAKIEGMPHLFSATYWYKDGEFYFATPHLRKPYVTIWQMYNWKLIKKVNIGGDGFFVKTHPSSAFLWADNGSDELILIDKEDYTIAKKIPIKNKRYIHTEFSSNGELAYLSIYESDGDLMVIQTDTFKEMARYFANVPVGKYNFVNKNRVFYPRLFGMSIFKEKCWGCHHQTAEAFGPPFNKIAKMRNEGEIISQIVDPANTFKQLGYKRNSMPKFNLNEKELKSIVDYIKSWKDK